MAANLVLDISIIDNTYSKNTLMDVKKAKVKKYSKRSIYIGASVLGATIFAIVLVSVDFNARHVSSNALSIGTVQAGKLDITVSSNGTLKARNVEWLAAQVDGRIAEVLVQPGDHVEKGQVLIKLTNPALIAEADQARSAWEGAVANNTSAQLSLERAALNQESVVLAAKSAAEKTEMEVLALREIGLASPAITLRKTELNLKQQRTQYEIEKKVFDKMVENAKAVVAVNKATADQLENAYSRARQQVTDMEIVAGLSGVVQELPYKTGQQVKPGEQLGKIAQPEELYSELQVPAQRSSEIQIGQKVQINTRVGYLDGHVTRVDPTVTNGNVTVDVDIEQKPDVSIRPGLAIEGVIYINELKHVLYVEKPAFARANDNISIYRLDDEKAYAARTNIRVGKMSVNYIEVVDGLKAGDKIIVSDSSAWQDHSKIKLN